MVCESEIRAIWYPRHVTRHAGLSIHLLSMRLVRVAGLTASVISRYVLIEFLVRGMARDAIQPSGATEEAGAGGQPQRLISGVTRITQIDNLCSRFGISPVTLAAEPVHGHGGELRRSLQPVVGVIPDVRRGGTVADFTTHAELVRDDFLFLP